MKIINNNVIKFPNFGFKVIFIVIFVFGIIIPLFIQIFILLQQSTVKDEVLVTSHKILHEDLEIKKEKVTSLEKHLKELENIKIKALEGLLELDAKRVYLMNEISKSKKESEDIKNQMKRMHKNVEKAKKELEQTLQAKVRKVVTNVVYVGVPHQRATNARDVGSELLPQHQERCNIRQCFDFSKCSVLKKFTFHLYKPISVKLSSTYHTITLLQEYYNDWMSSCIVLVLLDLNDGLEANRKYLMKLPSWDTGHNHILVIKSNSGDNYCKMVKTLQLKHTMLIVSRFCKSFRKNFDYLLPDFDTLVTVGDTAAVPLYPLSRRYILFFASEYMTRNRSSMIQPEYIRELNNTDDVYIKTECNNLFWNKCTSGWCTCNLYPGWRKGILKTALFNLIIIDYSNPYFFSDIIDSLRCGSIPVFLGLTNYLPLADVINWKLASVAIPLQRLSELMLILKSMPFSDIVSLKLQGQFLYTTYFSSEKVLMSSILTNLRSRIGLTPTEIIDFPATFITKGQALTKTESTTTRPSESLRFIHNFSYIGKNQYISWNQFPGALRLYPVTPWNDPAPSTIQFLDEGKDFYMPIGDGTGGDGVAFSRSLGGDHPVEQFTILMLTYDREAILMEALQRLSGLKYLNKVIVVWNHPVDPPVELEWPDIGVQIEVIRTGKNSLNNRFIPYDAIRTEAILSMDDDIYLRHDEIELAFRVWRENRDRLVGFPGRHHSYNSTSKSFYYNSEHSCELSLVLTGGAFFHKYYSYIYTYDMNHAIREMVDEYMNCEDIAMNYLVAHITKKPPIKVTSRWTFRCPGCPVALSADAHHFDERNACMSYFEKLYGYNPLKRTQFRADSILFKTRLPSSMTKCFQFV